MPLSLCILYIPTQTRFRFEPAVAVRKLPKYGASHAGMTLVPTAGKGLLMEYTRYTIRIWQKGVLQLPVMDKVRKGINYDEGIY